MKTSKTSSALFAAVLLMMAPMVSVMATDGPKAPAKKAVVKVVAYTIDPAQSSITWHAKRTIGRGDHKGNVKFTKGELSIDGTKLTGGSFVADMASMTESENNERVTTHIKSDDFFAVDKNPTSTFKITKATPIAGAAAGADNYTITGDLMIKGTTKPVTFPAMVKISNTGAEATAKVTVNRLEYDIKYQAAIIGTVADRVIEDTFTLDLKLVAKP